MLIYFSVLYNYTYFANKKHIMSNSDQKKKKQDCKKQILDIVIHKKKYRDQTFSAHSLADEMGVSIYQLSRIMKRDLNMSYTDLVHQARIKDAQKYLVSIRGRKMTVDDISVMVGFNNRQSFFSAFRKWVNKTPEQYRNSILNA